VIEETLGNIPVSIEEIPKFESINMQKIVASKGGTFKFSFKVNKIKDYEYWVVATSQSPMVEKAKYSTRFITGLFRTEVVVLNADGTVKTDKLSGSVYSFGWMISCLLLFVLLMK
jgi:hypothetical protein